MNILHLIKYCNFACGDVHAAVDLACEQANQNHNVIFVSSGGYHEQLLTDSKVKCLFLQEPSKNIFKLIIIFFKFLTILHKNKPDIIHAHMTSNAIIGWLAGRLFCIPLVTTVHNSFDKYASLMRLGDRVIAVSNSVANEMSNKGIPINKLRVVLNGTLGVKRRLIIKTDEAFLLLRPSIVTICGLHPRKGVNYLIEAFNRAQNSLSQTCHLYIVGGGPNETEYKNQSLNSSGSQNIHFLGALEDTVSILNQTDIFILASLAEPAGLVISEAREAGAAIIASDVGGIPEMLDYGKSGILVEAKNVEKISESIIELLSNKDTLNAYKESSKKDIEKFHISRVVRETTLVYQEVI